MKCQTEKDLFSLFKKWIILLYSRPLQMEFLVEFAELLQHLFLLVEVVH